MTEAANVAVTPSEVGRWVSDASEALGLFPSVIKSGEAWSSTCEDVRARAKVAIGKLGEVALAHTSPDAGALREAAKPWADSHGDLPDYDHPLRCVFESGVQYTVELLAKELNVAEYEPCDGTEEFDGDLGGTLLNIVQAAGSTDEHGDYIPPRELRARALAPEPSAAPDAGALREAIPTPALHEGGRFLGWPTIDLAQQCLSQAREQLDPEFSQFMTAVAARLTLAPEPPAALQPYGDVGPCTEWGLTADRRTVAENAKVAEPSAAPVEEVERLPDISALRGAEKLAHLMAWHHFGLRFDQMERQSKSEVLHACQLAIDWMNQPLAARNAALHPPAAQPAGGEVSASAARLHIDKALHSGDNPAINRAIVDDDDCVFIAYDDVEKLLLAVLRTPASGVVDYSVRQRLRDVLFAFTCTNWDAGAKHDLSEEIWAMLSAAPSHPGSEGGATADDSRGEG